MTLMIDVTHSSVQRVPADTPYKVALYITGSPDIQATPEDRARFAHAAGLVLIDQSDSANPDLGDAKIVKDTEAGASTIGVTAGWVAARHAAGKPSSPYVSAGDLAALAAAIADKGALDELVTFWVADWNLSQAEAEALLGKDVGNGAIIAAVQFASPSSNPATLLPGTSLTLAQANCDLSVTLDAWMAKSKPAPPPVHEWSAEIQVSVPAGSTGTLHFHGSVNLDDGKWAAGGLPGVPHWSGPGGGEWRINGLKLDALPLG